MRKNIITMSIMGMILLSSFAMVPISVVAMGTGNILYVGGSGPGNYTSIQGAINDASSGDTVFVFDDISPYRENLVITKSINLIGEDINTTIINGSGTEIAVHLLANSINISGFTIENNSKDLTNNMVVLESDFNTISENKINHNKMYGIYLYNSNNNTITNNRVQSGIPEGTNYPYGVNLYNSDNNTISGNTFKDGNAILFSGNNNTFRDNTLLNCVIFDNGAFVGLSKYNDIDTSNTYNGKPIYYCVHKTGMTITDPGLVFLVNCESCVVSNMQSTAGFYHIALINSKDITIKDSKFYDLPKQSESYAIILENTNFTKIIGNKFNNSMINIISISSNNNTIQNNNIENCNYGIFLVGSSDNIIKNNIIEKTAEYGILIETTTTSIGLVKSTRNTVMGNILKDNTGSAISIKKWGLGDWETNNNYVYHNNFVNNTQQAYDDCKNHWNSTSLEGNYWDDYTGIDADSNGIGDTPYGISGGDNQDLYPLMNIWNEPPVAGFTNITDGLEATFDASSSYDFEGEIVSYEWEFGDGTNGTGITIKHTYINNGSYTVNLTVTDEDNKTSKKSMIVSVSGIGEKTPPTVKITKPERAFYMGNKKIRRLFLRMAFVIGSITVEVNASDSGSGIDRVEFYVNGKLKGNRTTAPYSFNWTKDRLVRFIHVQVLKVVAYDKYGNAAADSMLVKKFL